MSLQRRLSYLLAAYAGFTLLAAFGTVYGIQLHVEDALGSFERSVGEAAQLDRLRLDMRERCLELREIVSGGRPAGDSFRTRAEELFSQLEQMAEFSAEVTGEAAGNELRVLTGMLQRECTACLELVAEGRLAEAQVLLEERIENDLRASLELHLAAIKSAADTARNRTLDNVVATNTQVLAFSLLIGVLGATLVTVGTALVRRWVMVPSRRLQQAAREFERGNLGFRVALEQRDELGELARALNAMAHSLAQAQVNLRVSEAKYRSLFENLRDAAIICDGTGRVIACHDGDTGLLGGDEPANPTGRLLEVWSHWRDGTLDWEALIKRVLSEGRQIKVADIHLQRTSEEGDAAWVDLIAYPVEFADSRYVALVLRDVTERHRLEQQTRRTEAIEATVTLARGIAHDFNNLLTSAIGTLSLLAQSSANETDTSERLRRALRACWQAAGLSRKLLSFAGGDPGHPQVVSLRQTVDLILDSLDEPFWEDVEVRVVGEAAIAVSIDRDQLTQILLNLILNAREAMPQGGALGITIERAHPERGDAAEGAYSHAAVTVSDTGTGIAPEIREHLFEPFFTTKGHGARRSRGMGLAVVYAAVKNAGGFIEVESSSERGAVFRVYLPLEERPLDVSEPARPMDAAPRGQAKVLLVDDEPMVLQACADALSMWGYAVVTAESKAQAKQRFTAEDNGALELAIIDMRLKDGSGAALALELAALDPTLRFIFTSGFTGERIPPELGQKVTGQLAKPFELNALAAAVSAALARTGG